MMLMVLVRVRRESALAFLVHFLQNILTKSERYQNKKSDLMCQKVVQKYK